jgi:CRISPR-associated protein Cmr5
MANKDLDRKRAKFAYSCVKQFIGNDEDKNKKYRGYIRNTPTMILNNGLGATFAFMFSKRLKKDGEVYNAIAENIYDWIIKDENKYLLKLDNKNNAQDKLEELMNQVIELPSSEYRMVSNEILSLLAWMKRFVEGLVEGEDNGE